MKKQLLVTGMAALCVFAVYTSNSTPEPDFEPPPTKPKAYPQVTTVQPRIGSYRASIKAYGEIAPVQTLNLAAEVSGKVVKLSPYFKSGARLKAGDTLLRIDDETYHEAVASAQSARAAAEVTLLQQKSNRTQAKAEWKRSGLKGSPDSKLALYEPQVKAAQAALEYARRTLAKAKADLDKTIIRVPFNALVISRSIELGSYVQAGSELALLYGTDQLELTLPLAAKDWQHLPLPPEKKARWQVKLTDTANENRWQGYVDRVAQHVDSQTRQRSLIVRIDNPLDHNPPLYPGTFIEADIPGKVLEDVWQVPASAVTQNNEIWFVNHEQILTKAPAKLRLRMLDKAYLLPNPKLEQALIVALPLASYLPGMKVEPSPVADELSTLSQAEPSGKISP